MPYTTLIGIDLPDFRLKHRNGHEFTLTGSYTGDGYYILEPKHGWNELCIECQQDLESLYEDVEELIYSAMPELFERKPNE
jgi:hypothetical protein